MYWLELVSFCYISFGIGYTLMCICVSNTAITRGIVKTLVLSGMCIERGDTMVNSHDRAVLWCRKTALPCLLFSATIICWPFFLKHGGVVASLEKVADRVLEGRRVQETWAGN